MTESQESVREEPPTEIHKPNPWRGFLKEYAVIVIGVLTALAAQQAAEWWQWRSQVAQAKDVLATELADSVRSAIMRVRVTPCVERRLDAITDILDAAAKTGSLPPVGIIGQAPALLWPRGAWESVVASQTASHFPREQLANMARVYKFVERAESFNVMERQVWSTLYTMVGPGRSLDPASEAQLRQALSLARLSNRMLMTSVASLMQETKRENLPFSRSDLDRIGAIKRAPLTGEMAALPARGMALICGPIGPVPTRYGQSQNTYYQSLYDEFLRGVPDFGDGAKIP
jgi:hypothetical protein